MAKVKERKAMAKHLEHWEPCKLEEDLGLAEAEAKAKVEEKEKARKEEKARKFEEKVRQRKERKRQKTWTVCRICHQEGHWGNECPNRRSVRNVEAEEQPYGGEYVHQTQNPPNQEQYPKPNVVETGSIRQATSRPDPRVVTRRVRSFTPKPFYRIATPPEEFPEVFPLTSETDEEESGDIHITYARMVRVVDKEETDQSTTPRPVHDGDLGPATNPFYGRLPSPGFTDSEEDLEGGEASGVCQGCGVTLEPTCTRPQTLENSDYPRIPELYPGEDRYLRLQRKLRSEAKPFDKEAIEDAVRRENEWIQCHIDEEEKKKKERDVDQVRMVREEFHDVAEWFLMDATDDDSDWLIVEEQGTTESIRAVQVEETVPEEGLELIILDSGSDASLLPSSHPKAASVNTGTTGILLEDAQGNPIKAAGMVTAVVDVEQGQDCWTAPSISENFIVSDSTNILLSTGRILKNGWKLEYNPEIPEGEQTLSAQYNITVSSMVLVSPDGKAMARIFYKRNSCCLLGRISVIGNGRTHVPEGTRWTGHGYGTAGSSTDSRTAVERSVSVRIPSYFSELLDRTPNGKWTIMEDGTPFIVYKGTTFLDPKDAFPGWKYRTTMIGEGGSEWSIVELYSDYGAVRSHSLSIPECHGTAKRICTILHATSGNFFTFCNDFKVVMIGRGPETSFTKPEHGIPEELSTPVVPVKIAPGRSEGVLGPYNRRMTEMEIRYRNSRCRIKSEGKERVRVEAQPQEPTEEERLAHEATHIPFAHWCEACVEAKSKQDHEKKNPEVGKESVGVPYPITQLDFHVSTRKGYASIGWNLLVGPNVSGSTCIWKTDRREDCGESLEMGS